MIDRIGAQQTRVHTEFIKLLTHASVLSVSGPLLREMIRFAVSDIHIPIEQVAGAVRMTRERVRQIASV